MKCPHCGKTITARTMAKVLASKGGSRSTDAKRQAAINREANKKERIVKAQHEETGRIWEGKLKDLPSRYFVIRNKQGVDRKRSMPERLKWSGRRVSKPRPQYALSESNRL